MKNILGFLTIGILATTLAAWGQEGAKDDLKKSGQDVKEAGKATGRAGKHAAKGVAKGTKKGVHKAAGATAKGAEKVKDKTEQ